MGALRGCPWRNRGQPLLLYETLGYRTPIYYVPSTLDSTSDQYTPHIDTSKQWKLTIMRTPLGQPKVS